MNITKETREKNSEQLLEFLKSQGKKTLHLSSYQIRKSLKFERPRTVRVVQKSIKWTPSNQTIITTLKELEKQGKIKLDYSNRLSPRIDIKA